MMNAITVGVILTAAALTVAAEGDKRDVLTEVIAEKQTVRLGDPIVVSVLVASVGTNTSVLRPTAIEDVSRALHVTKP